MLPNPWQFCCNAWALSGFQMYPSQPRVSSSSRSGSLLLPRKFALFSLALCHGGYPRFTLKFNFLSREIAEIFFCSEFFTLFGIIPRAAIVVRAQTVVVRIPTQFCAWPIFGNYLLWKTNFSAVEIPVPDSPKCVFISLSTSVMQYKNRGILFSFLCYKVSLWELGSVIFSLIFMVLCIFLGVSSLRYDRTSFPELRPSFLVI